MLTTTLVLSVFASALPTSLWGWEIRTRRRRELRFNIRMAQSLGHAATLRDHETGAHNFRVTYLASLFGEACGLDRAGIRSLMKGAFLHDVGKIGIPDAILLKDGPLDGDELAIMRAHPGMGVQLLADLPWFTDAIPVVRHHHERYDGSGYPYGLAGEAIPLGARIFSVVDVFDALQASRPYKSAFPLQEIVRLFEEELVGHFDPAICQRFLQLAPSYFDLVAEREESELRAMLEARRRKLFGI